MMNSKEIIAKAENILSENGLKKTSIRVKILAYLLKQKHAVAKNDLENILKGEDRITIYRTLKSFEEKEIIHRIQGLEGEIKFALPLLIAGDKPSHEAPHVHFHCMKCLVTLCLPIKIPAIKMPLHYQAIHTNLAVEGICKDCR